MQWTFTVLTRPVTFEQIVPLADVKEDLDVNFADDDVIIAAHRDAAINWLENHLNRFLGTATLRFIGSEIASSGLALPFGPIVSVEAMRVAGTAFVGFRSISGEPWRLLPPSGQLWPTYTKEAGAVEADYTVGYVAGAAPASAKQAVKLIVSIFYDKPARPEDEWEAVRNLVRDLRLSGIG